MASLFGLFVKLVISLGGCGEGGKGDGAYSFKAKAKKRQGVASMVASHLAEAILLSWICLDEGFFGAGCLLMAAGDWVVGFGGIAGTNHWGYSFLAELRL